jgi:hypothetical protein
MKVADNDIDRGQPTRKEWYEEAGESVLWRVGFGTDQQRESTGSPCTWADSKYPRSAQ